MLCGSIVSSVFFLVLYTVKFICLDSVIEMEIILSCGAGVTFFNQRKTIPC